jgi:hypothetical protein
MSSDIDAAKRFSNQAVGELFPTDLLGDAKAQDQTSLMQALCLTIATCTGAIIEALEAYSCEGERYQEIKDERDAEREELIAVRHERDQIATELKRLKEAK